MLHRLSCVLAAACTCALRQRVATCYPWRYIGLHTAHGHIRAATPGGGRTRHERVILQICSFKSKFRHFFSSSASSSSYSPRLALCSAPIHFLGGHMQVCRFPCFPSFLTTSFSSQSYKSCYSIAILLSLAKVAQG